MIRLTVSLLVLAIFAGCQTSPFGGGGDALPEPELLESGGTPAPPLDDGLRIAPEQRFKDVPLPSNLREDYERTYVFESDNLQIGRMVYNSKASVSELGQFYIRECPVSGWNLDSTTQDDDGAQLRFSKPGRQLDVTIRRQGVGRAQLLILHLTPAPGRGGN
ncbi:MAG: hypothetical protein HYV27_05150 [Candidatus Hydrogenedentes bacterium]|nr:hypothetical protein [Candidatus Hydrogenedentota bacterium]